MPSAGQDKGMDPRIREDDGVGAGLGMDPRIREHDGVAGLTVKVIQININALKAAINTLACDLHQQA